MPNVYPPITKTIREANGYRCIRPCADVMRVREKCPVWALSLRLYDDDVDSIKEMRPAYRYRCRNGCRNNAGAASQSCVQVTQEVSWA